MTFQAIQDRKAELVRKALQGVVITAPVTAPAITNLTELVGGEVDLAALPEGYESTGWPSEDGFTFSRDISSADTGAFGSTQPVRSDITSDSTSLAFTALETRLATLQLSTGANAAALAADPDTGEVSLAKPSRPRQPYYRVLAIGVDVDDQEREIYIARFLPRARVTSLGDQSMSGPDSQFSYGFTFTAFEDSALGYSDKMIFGGPGWQALLADMGIDTQTP